MMMVYYIGGSTTCLGVEDYNRDCDMVSDFPALSCSLTCLEKISVSSDLNRAEGEGEQLRRAEKNQNNCLVRIKYVINVFLCSELIKMEAALR